MAAGINDKFTEATNGTRPSPTTLTATKGIGASSITVGAVTGWATATSVHFVIYNTALVNGVTTKVAGSQTDWKGIVSGTTITNLTLKAGTDAGYPIGAVVEASPTGAWATEVVDGILVEHNQDGTHKSTVATAVQTAILPIVYPVGAVFIAVVSTNPGTLFGFGTWVAFGTGRSLVGIDTGQTEFNTIEKTGGEKTHVLTATEMPSHTHTPPLGEFIASGGTGGSYPSQSGANWGFRGSAATASAGSDGAHNNLQPYITVYMWKRTA